MKTYPNFRARLYTVENHDVLEPWIQAGILQVWEMDDRDTPFDSTLLAAQGFFPESPGDPKSKLLAPSPADLKEIKLWMFEGMATMSSMLMGSSVTGGLAARAARGEQVSSQDSISFKDGDTKTRVGGNPPSHYNVTQKWIHSCVMHSRRLPGHVIWTSHETVAKDDRRGNTLLVGPELIGTAATAEAPRWFANTIHVYRTDTKVKDTKTKETQVKSEYRLYLKPHYIEDLNIPYKAVLRVPPGSEEDAGVLIPEFILNTKTAFAELVGIREKVAAHIIQLIQEIRDKRRTA